jgi:hypothetical protein
MTSYKITHAALNGCAEMLPGSWEAATPRDAIKRMLGQVGLKKNDGSWFAADAETIAAVKAHAIANYEKHGWDIIIETYDDADLVVAMSNATTTKAAIAAVKRFVKPLAEYRSEIQATEW